MKQKNEITFDLILLAAGKGERMGFEKQFALINGQPIWQIALEQIRHYPACNTIIVAFPKTAPIDKAFFDKNSALRWVYGGASRSDSVWNALQYYNSLTAKSPYIAIHDAARPMLDHAVLDRMMDKIRQGEKAVIPTLDASDTIKKFSKKTYSATKHSGTKYSRRHITKTLNRDKLVLAQTPQLFEANIIQTSYRNIFAKQTENGRNGDEYNPSDDSSLVEANGTKVAIVTGSPNLRKITVKEDYDYLKHLLEQNFETRTATGYDVHKFRSWTADDTSHHIKICGVEVEHDYGIDAHSDGDVGIHALCDAIFGCLADGDIGSHFPPSDERWKNADSELFLNYAINKIQSAGGRVILLDVTIICEMPKIEPERHKMKNRLAKICGLPMNRISIKASTSEKLGFTGRKEGLSAFATATLSLPSSQE